jgi:hypothetical protein
MSRDGPNDASDGKNGAAPTSGAAPFPFRTSCEGDLRATTVTRTGDVSRVAFLAALTPEVIARGRPPTIDWRAGEAP